MEYINENNIPYLMAKKRFENLNNIFQTVRNHGPKYPILQLLQLHLKKGKAQRYMVSFFDVKIHTTQSEQSFPDGIRIA